VTNKDASSDFVHLISTTTRMPVAGITANVNPSNAGNVYCNSSKLNYTRFDIGKTLLCEPKPNQGFAFSSWSGLVGANSSNNAVLTFPVSKFGTLSANFIPAPPFSLPPEFWAAVSAIITSFFIPSILQWFNDKRQRRNLREYMNNINSQLDRINELDIMKEIEGLYTNGKITYSHYEMLKDKISEYYKKES
jgi:hypothetical protein